MFNSFNFSPIDFVSIQMLLKNIYEFQKFIRLKLQKYKICCASAQVEQDSSCAGLSLADIVSVNVHQDFPGVGLPGADVIAIDVHQNGVETGLPRTDVVPIDVH